MRQAVLRGKWGGSRSLGVLLFCFRELFEHGVLSCKVAAAITAAGTLNISKRVHMQVGVNIPHLPLPVCWFSFCSVFMLLPFKPPSLSHRASFLLSHCRSFIPGHYSHHLQMLTEENFCTQIHTHTTNHCVLVLKRAYFHFSLATTCKLAESFLCFPHYNIVSVFLDM